MSVAVFLVSPSPAWEQAACGFTELLDAIWGWGGLSSSKWPRAWALRDESDGAAHVT